jgi:hypothetical protein
MNDAGDSPGVRDLPSDGICSKNDVHGKSATI